MSAETMIFRSKPCIADFSGFHGLNFAVELKGMEMFEAYPGVAGWFRRMQALGHGSPVHISGYHALDTARDADPVDLGDQALAEPK